MVKHGLLLLLAFLADPAVAQQSNIAPQPCSGTITTGATPQTIIPAAAAGHGFMLGNLSATEVLAFALTGAVTATGPWILGTSAATASTTTFVTPPNFGTGGSLIVQAATAGHAFSCVWW
jgi:hypothetical protein